MERAEKGKPPRHRGAEKALWSEGAPGRGITPFPVVMIDSGA
jgi:hypothetical protein